MNQIEVARKCFLTTALACLGTPYRWAGDDPSGFDCSGFVVECLKSTVSTLPPNDLTANELYGLFGGQGDVKPDSRRLLFWLDSLGRATYVAICLDRWFQIGSGGGDETTREVQDAWRDNAFVKIRPIPRIRAHHRIGDPFAVYKERAT